MFVGVMTIFFLYGATFIIFDDYNKYFVEPLNETEDWHLIAFAVVSMTALGILLHRYAIRMDERITNDRIAKETKMRRQLTQNISHELKTPVASILGYVETIIENPDIDMERRNMFVQRTYNQAKRLTALLNDMSTLNKMDYAPESMAKERVDVAIIVQEIGEETILAREKAEMTWRNCLPEHIVVNGNYGLIYGIFRNLIDNAISYAGKGCYIEISATELLNKWRFEISDNGIGVPEEHMLHIFERFYRVDKGRSRRAGGTGLGLAIVKNAVLLHKGTIHVEKNKPKGIKFVFTIHK